MTPLSHPPSYPKSFTGDFHRVNWREDYCLHDCEPLRRGDGNSSAIKLQEEEEEEEG